jgi:hypothetical protein
MSNILVFTPQHKLDCQRNYDDFIAFTKNELTLFEDFEFKTPNGLQKGWACDKWSWPNQKGKNLTIVFGKSHSRSKYDPYKAPFSDFAKAYVRYQQSIDFKFATVWASSLALIHEELEKSAIMNGRPSVDIMDIDNATINAIENNILASQSLAAGAKRNTAASLQSVLAFLKDMRFKLGLQEWKNPFSRPADTKIKLDKESRKAEEDKCPSDYQMLQVAEAFRSAETPEQKYFTSLCVMLMCQPSRSVELNGLTIHSLQRSSEGRLYLMWNPAKGGDPVRKWVPKLLEDVVTQAFERLIEISAPARKAAKFAYENPGMFMIHDKCSTPAGFPQDQYLTYPQFANAMALQTGRAANGSTLSWNKCATLKWFNALFNRLNNTTDWRREKLGGLTLKPNNEVFEKNGRVPIDVGLVFPTYADLRAVVDEQYITEGFPNYGTRPIWECLTLVRENEFHKTFTTKEFSWVTVGHGMISDAIGSERLDGKESVFDQLGITDEDGARLRITTHQFRHWLNTKLMLAGEEDWVIARWSGRADIKQNRAYDGRTPEQRSRQLNLIGRVPSGGQELTVGIVSNALSEFSKETPPPAIILHDLGLPIALKGLGLDRTGVAQFSGLGYCVHNYAESPCLKNNDCISCSEHVCLKGLPHTLEELHNLMKLHDEQLTEARKNEAGSVFGAGRWVEALSFKLAKVKTIISVLENPSTPEGAAIRVPSELDPSIVRRSFGVTAKDGIRKPNNPKAAESPKLNKPINLLDLADTDLD